MDAIVVVGASLGGLRAADALRAGGFAGRLVLVGEEPHGPYNRPPLSKAVLAGEAGPESTALFTPANLEAEWITGTPATALDLAARRVVLADGRALPFDGLVLATGAVPRRLRDERGHVEGVHVLRTLDDALALRDALDGGPRVAVVGAGFVGSEVASTCRARGLDVTLLEAGAVPMQRGLGDLVGMFCANLHRDAGVDLRLGVGVVAVEGRGRVERLRLTDGTTLAADVVVVGVGVRPATDWLERSGLPLADGVLCDGRLAVVGTDRVVACGDVARWPHARFGATMRVEHWTNAVEGAAAAAATLLAWPAPAPEYAPALSFWSDQHGVKLQSVGMPSLGEELRIVEGSPDERRFVALAVRGGRVIGAVAANEPRRMVACRRLVEEQAVAPDALP